MELLQKVHAHNIVKWAKDKPEVVVFSADLTSSCEADLFRDTYPDRFFSMGLTEQNMLSMAGGMAREGYTPYIHTFAVFIYRRALDQIAMSVAYPNVPVRMIGFLPGIMTPGGASHQAIEDVAVMRSLPNMTILEVGDATEVESVLDVAQAVNGPVYVRMLRGEIPRLFDASEPFVLNRARVLSRGTDIALITSGICTEEAMRVTHLLKEKGVSIQHLHVSTLKPFTDPQVLEAVSSVRHGVITMENHTIIGGLGSAVAEVMAENGVGRKLVRIGLKDTFAHGASKPYLMRQMGLDALALVGEVERLLGTSFGIGEGDLKAVRLTAVHSEAKAEAL
ncbi:MAG TPA: transketolase C-terminal domain-containing protein [Symbiobacteriaceae bacterium]|nr:transketolase C-terminal domain-containing protein [Symbiobacteriaceae bacterium]